MWFFFYWFDCYWRYDWKDDIKSYLSIMYISAFAYPNVTNPPVQYFVIHYCNPSLILAMYVQHTKHRNDFWDHGISWYIMVHLGILFISRMLSCDQNLCNFITVLTLRVCRLQLRHNSLRYYLAYPSNILTILYTACVSSLFTTPIQYYSQISSLYIPHIFTSHKCIFTILFTFSLYCTPNS